MKTVKTYFRKGAVLLVISLFLSGYPLHGHAMSLFMGGDEPKIAPPPPKPVGAKPQVPPAQPGPKPTPATGSVQAPATGAPSTTAVLPPPVVTGSPAVSAGTPKLGGVPASSSPSMPAQTAPASPAPTSVQSGAQKSVAAQPAVPAAPAVGVPKELSKPAPVAAAAKTPDLVEIVEGYTYDPKSRRDPFQSLTRLIKVDKTRAEMPPLQRVQISDLKLLGIMWGGYGYYALVQTPDGKGYTVKEGMLMGSNNGVITTITDKTIIVTEPGVDITGKKSTKDVELLLRPKEVS